VRVVGLASLAPFDRADPDNPINRRISIIVMTKAAEENSIKEHLPASVQAESTAAP